MSGLWTPPGGEPSEPPRGPASGGPPPAPAAPGEAAPSADELAALRELHARLAATPVGDVIVNHGIGIWQLALVHLGVTTPPDELGRRPAPNLAAASLAIDALTALLDALAGRLGEGEEMLRDALSQAQMLFVEVTESQG